MKTELTTFNYNNNQIRTQLIANEPYFCGIDVCNVLGIKNNRNIIARLDDGVHSVDVIDKLGRKQTVSYISEPNLYKVAFQSRKPAAEPFVNWVCKEVLPSIRKTGAYVDPTQKQLDLIPVKEYTRRLPSGKKEIVLSEKARSEIGGIVKSCVGVAIRDALKPVCVSQFKTDETQSECERNLYMAIKAYGDERERNGLINALQNYKTYFEVADILKQATPIQISAK